MRLKASVQKNLSPRHNLKILEAAERPPFLQAKQMKKVFSSTLLLKTILFSSAIILSGMSLQACDFFKKKDAEKKNESAKAEDSHIETEKKIDEILKKVDKILVNMEESQKHARDEKPLESELNKQDTDTPSEAHPAPEHAEKKIEETQPQQKPQHGPDPGTEKKTSAEKPKESPDVIYKKAMDAYKSKNFESAAVLFDEIVLYFPGNDLLDNSLYWKGESLFGLKKYDEAIEAFKIVAEKYPDSEKAPSSLLKAAYAYQAMGNREESIVYFKKTVTTYPFSQQGAVALSMLEKP